MEKVVKEKEEVRKVGRVLGHGWEGWWGFGGWQEQAASGSGCGSRVTLSLVLPGFHGEDGGPC